MPRPMAGHNFAHIGSERIVMAMTC